MITEAAGEILAACGVGAITRGSRLGGGDTCDAFRIDAAAGSFFLKVQRPPARNGLFAAEADGLVALARSTDLRVPEVVGFDTAHLVLEFLPLCPRDALADGALGKALARMHAVDHGRFGWERDNFLGRSPQINTSRDDWPSFYASSRLLPQARGLAEAGFARVLVLCDQLVDVIDRFFVGHRPAASLIHGDLWSGNAAALEDGTPVLFDPAVHFADRECDLAMAALFGGFGESFFAAYEAMLPLPDGAAERQGLYQLYHILNHATLFGGAYVDRAERLLRHLIARVR